MHCCAAEDGERRKTRRILANRVRTEVRIVPKDQFQDEWERRSDRQFELCCYGYLQSRTRTVEPHK